MEEATSPKKRRHRLDGYVEILEQIRNGGKMLVDLPVEYRDEKEIVLAAVQRHGRNFYGASKRLQDDYDVVIEAIRCPDLGSDIEIVTKAVCLYGCELRFASKALQNNFDVVTIAVQQDGYALRYASEAMQDNFDLVLKAVQSNPEALIFASNAMKDNYDVVLAAVRQNSRVLRYASEALKNNYDVVLAAVRQDGESLQLASDAMKDNYDLVLLAVGQNGESLKIASPAFRDNFDLVLLAVRNQGRSIVYASPNMRANRTIVLEAVRQSYYAYTYISPSFHNDVDVIAGAISSMPHLDIVRDYFWDEFETFVKDSVFSVFRGLESRCHWYNEPIDFRNDQHNDNEDGGSDGNDQVAGRKVREYAENVLKRGAMEKIWTLKHALPAALGSGLLRSIILDYSDIQEDCHLANEAIRLAPILAAMAALDITHNNWKEALMRQD